jgi:hypothetical protein
MMKRFHFALAAMLVLGVLGVCGAAVYRALQSPPPENLSLASFAPQGALLSIESPDFKALLKSWSNSQEEQRWLKSDNYTSFSHSRLFSRLGEAQDQFAATAGFPPDAQFLQQVAGGQSLFAWYDIGNLEFLYITRMPSGEAAKTPLLQMRDKFDERKAGDSSFFVRTKGDPAQTVAFAVHGDYLLLATREDLIANALQLMQQPVGATLQHEHWYAEAVAAVKEQPGDLRMALNMTKIVPSPYFRSYWIQQNITELKQYSSALSDLYLTPESFREERVLLATNPDKEATNTDLAPVLGYLPRHIGVYRAQAQPTTAAILHQFEDKLLSRNASAYRDTHIAPVADLSTPLAGDTSDFEERIDETSVVVQPRAASLSQLQDLLIAAHPEAMLVFSSASQPQTPSSETVFSPIHTAVILSSSAGWNQAAWQQALSAALAPRLTIGKAGLAWQEHHHDNVSWVELSGIHGLALAIQGNVCVIASDEATLLLLLEASHHAASTPKPATIVAGFDHRSEREGFVRLPHLLDGSGSSAQSGGGDTPPFFSRNMASLSSTFQDLDAETFTESPMGGGATHQTVFYQWRH